MNLTLDSSSFALLIVDMQSFFTRRDFPFSEAAEKIVDGGVSAYFRQLDEIVIPIVYLGMGARGISDTVRP